MKVKARWGPTPLSQYQNILREENIRAKIEMSCKDSLAVIRVRPPSISLLLTVQLVTALIVRACGTRWQGAGKRQEKKLEHLQIFCQVKSFQKERWAMVKGKVRGMCCCKVLYRKIRSVLFTGTGHECEACFPESFCNLGNP